jgi:CheY-like chemotaxis protein
MQEDVARCKNSGMDNVWFKPISKVQLLQNVQHVLLQQH